MDPTELNSSSSLTIEKKKIQKINKKEKYNFINKYINKSTNITLRM